MTCLTFDTHFECIFVFTKFFNLYNQMFTYLYSLDNAFAYMPILRAAFLPD